MLSVCYWGIVVIYAIEYIGLGHFIPGIQRVPLFLSLFIFFALIILVNPKEIFRHFQTKAFLVFFFHTILSILYAYVSLYAYRLFKMQLGYLILFVSTFLVIRNKRQLNLLLISFVFFHVLLVLLNISKLNPSERVGGYTGGYFLGDGNDFAWSLAIFLPLIIYLLSQAKNIIIKMGYIGSGLLIIAGIVGTGSRGAFLAVSVAITYLVLKSQKKMFAICLSVAVGVGALAFAPESYIDRIASIGSYEEDSSALGRIMAWKAAMRMAIGDPLGVGAGNFNTAYGHKYMPKEINQQIYSPNRWISPHSIYFLVLGEYGVIGLITVLSILFFNYRDNKRQIDLYRKQKKKSHEEVDTLTNLPKFLNASLIAFSAGGVFLGGINYPHIYILTALILRTKQLNTDAGK